MIRRINARSGKTTLFKSIIHELPHIGHVVGSAAQRELAAPELVLNWHLTDACNYGCRYCYARWSDGQADELYRHSGKSSFLLKELYRFFSYDNFDNPLRDKLVWSGVRLSLAGGEPLLFPEHTLRIAKEAKTLGFDVSLITNASLLTHEIIPALSANLSMLGISLDSASPATNRRIGRVNRADRVLCLDDLAKKIALARACNPNLIIKVNTVVNALNADEDLSEMIQLLRPDKWKLLRVLPVVTDTLSITDMQFGTFIECHRHLGSLLSVEDNRDMVESYLMVDPFGRFFQNRPTPSPEQPYIFSKAILEVGADAAFAQIDFNAARFAGRYRHSAELGDAA